MDREKVIKGLEIQLDNLQKYADATELLTLTQKHAKEILALLKEQEAKIEQLNRFVNGFSLDAMPVVRCKDCKHYKDGFCYNPNTYDDEKTRGNTVPDWFCADGERRTDDA